MRFSSQKREHVFSSTQSSDTKRRRRSEADRLKDFDMKQESFYSNQPTLPRFQILWPDFVYRSPNRGKQSKDCNKRDPDYNPKDQL